MDSTCFPANRSSAFRSLKHHGRHSLGHHRLSWASADPVEPVSRCLEALRGCVWHMYKDVESMYKGSNIQNQEQQESTGNYSKLPVVVLRAVQIHWDSSVNSLGVCCLLLTCPLSAVNAFRRLRLHHFSMTGKQRIGACQISTTFLLDTLVIGSLRFRLAMLLTCESWAGMEFFWTWNLGKAFEWDSGCEVPCLAGRTRSLLHRFVILPLLLLRPEGTMREKVLRVGFLNFVNAT